MASSAEGDPCMHAHPLQNRTSSVMGERHSSAVAGHELDPLTIEWVPPSSGADTPLQVLPPAHGSRELGSPASIPRWAGVLGASIQPIMG